MKIHTKTIDVTLSTAGAVTKSGEIAPGEFLLNVVQQAGGTITAAADLTITDDLTGMTLLSAANFGSTAQTVWTPRRLVNNAANAVASTSVYDYQPLTGKFTLAISGSTAGAGTGKFFIVCGG